MIGSRPDKEIRYPVSDVAAKYGASVAAETDQPDDAYADWPGEYVPVRLPWPLDSDARQEGETRTDGGVAEGAQGAPTMPSHAE